jgi:hypothetical protein
MSGGQEITQELSLGEVVSKTLELYRRDFSKYLILFIAVEVIIGVLNTLVRGAIVVPAVLPSSATPQEFLNWMPGFFGALIAQIALSAIITWIFYPLSAGAAVKLASERITTGRADLVTSVRLVVSRIVWIWAVTLVVGIIVSLGFIALVVPGIILAIMFSLVLQVVVIERAGFESLGRSRKLVNQRWLKTFALAIVFAIFFVIASIIVNAISGAFGSASLIVFGILSAFYLPLVPIALTVYYYSNAARIGPPQMGQAPTALAQQSPFQADASSVVISPGRLCAFCGSPVQADSKFCRNCGKPV